MLLDKLGFLRNICINRGYFYQDQSSQDPPITIGEYSTMNTRIKERVEIGILKTIKICTSETR